MPPAVHRCKKTRRKRDGLVDFRHKNTVQAPIFVCQFVLVNSFLLSAGLSYHSVAKMMRHLRIDSARLRGLDFEERPLWVRGGVRRVRCRRLYPTPIGQPLRGGARNIFSTEYLV